MSAKKTNWKQLFEKMPSNSNKNKDNVFKPTKIDLKNFSEKSVYDKEKAEFLKRKTRRNKSKKEDASLPSSVKTLIAKYGDVLVNVGASDMSKYNEYRKYNKKTKQGRK